MELWAQRGLVSSWIHPACCQQPSPQTENIPGPEMPGLGLVCWHRAALRRAERQGGISGCVLFCVHLENKRGLCRLEKDGAVRGRSRLQL